MNDNEILGELVGAAKRLAREAEERARAAGMSFLPVGETDGIRVNDVVRVGAATSTYLVVRIDPVLVDLLDETKGIRHVAALRPLSGPWKRIGSHRRLITTALRKVDES
jgi:hypothetical protein